MDTKERECTWIQCQCCGYIYMVERKIHIDASIIRSECPKCHYDKGLNCGSEKEEIYTYMNPNLDERFYIY